MSETRVTNFWVLVCLLLSHFVSFYKKTKYNNITLFARHYHANSLPSTEKAAKTDPKQDKSFSFFFHRL